MEKLATLGAIGEYQRPFLADTDHKKVSLYCGIPFCDTRCVYCSFPYGLYQDYTDKSQFLVALGRDIEDMKNYCSVLWLIGRYPLYGWRYTNGIR